MVAAPLIRRPSERREPSAITIADLLLLVGGAAFACSLPQQYHVGHPYAIANIPIAGSAVVVFWTGEAATKAGLALMPVIVARRFRYGGIPRPGDGLAILASVAFAHEFFHLTIWIDSFARWYLLYVRSSFGYPPSFSAVRETSRNVGISGNQIMGDYFGVPDGFAPGYEYRIWGCFTTGLFLVVATVLVLRWKRMPGWVKTVLLTAGAFACVEGVTYLISPSFVSASQPFSTRTGLSPAVTAQLAIFMGALPLGLLLGVPIAATILELRSADRSWVWTEWAGAAIALFALPTGLAIYWYADPTFSLRPEAANRLSVQLVTVGLLSWLIAKRLRSVRSMSRVS